MNNPFENPPKNLKNILKASELMQCLQNLVGESITLTGKPRTDGSNARKMVIDCLLDYGICDTAAKNEYQVIPSRGKGIPRLLLDLVDTYIVTSGNSYNLQVWNRFPNSKYVLIEYNNGKKIRCCDIRLVFLKVDVQKSIIESIMVLSPAYIEHKFGLFGKPTIKHQIIISLKKKNGIKNSVLLGTDTEKMIGYCRKTYKRPTENIGNFPVESKPFSIELLSKMVAQKLIGSQLQPTDTKNRGQMLELMVMSLLGYNSHSVGCYPDIPNQLLEVKVQDSRTIDLGKYSPEFESVVFSDITTKDIRYLIALTNADNNIIESVILVSGSELNEIFSFISDTNFKCQRSIPMSFFDEYKGLCVFNP